MSYLGSTYFDFRLTVSLFFLSVEAHLDVFGIGECSVCQGGRNCQGAGLFTQLYQTPSICTDIFIYSHK